MKLKLNYKELGVFFLLFCLNLKFAAITIIQDRSVVIDILVYIMLIITFNYSNWTYKSLIKITVIIIVYTLINFSQYKLNVLIPLLIIQSISGIRFKRYLIINLAITGITLLIMYLIYADGVNMSGYSFLIDRKIRMTFGFGHPNSAALYYYCFIINILLLIYFSKYKKNVPLLLFLIIPLWLYVYQKTASRSFLLSILILYSSYFYIFIGLIFNKKNVFKFTSYIYIFLILIFTSLTLYFSIYKANFKRLDQILSLRLSYYKRFLDQITPIDFLFGSNSYKNFVIDSSFIHLLFEGGIFFFIGFNIFYMLSSKNMINKKEWVPICIIMSFLAYGLMESLLLFNMLIGTNIFWILLYFYFKDGKMKL